MGDKRKIPGRILRTLKAGRLTGLVGGSYLGGKVLDKLKDRSTREKDELKRHVTNAKRVVDTMVDLRGPMLKVGQLLSTHSEAMPGEFVDVISVLQSKVPPMDYADIKGQIISELDGDPQELFVEFETEAFAAASIGQVHRAVIEVDGEHVPVAVKVQYPDAGQMIESDLRNMSGAVGMVKRVAGEFVGGENLDLTPIYEEVGEHLRQETDYARESYNAGLIAQVLRDVDGVVVPRVFNEYSSLRVITYEFMEGVPLPEFLESDADQDERNRVASLLAEAFWTQIFDNGVMHADPHPGNYLIQPDGRLALLDFGCVKIFSEAWSANFSKLVRSWIAGEREAEREAMVDLGLVGAECDEQEIADMRLIGQFLSAGLVEDQPFRFHDYDYVGRGKKVVEYFLRARRIPRHQRDFIFLARVSLGLYEYFSRLNSEVNFHRIAAPHIAEPWKGRRVAIPDFYLEHDW